MGFREEWCALFGFSKLDTSTQFHTSQLQAVRTRESPGLPLQRERDICAHVMPGLLGVLAAVTFRPGSMGHNVWTCAVNSFQPSWPCTMIQRPSGVFLPWAPTARFFVKKHFCCSPSQHCVPMTVWHPPSSRVFYQNALF